MGCGVSRKRLVGVILTREPELNALKVGPTHLARYLVRTTHQVVLRMTCVCFLLLLHGTLVGSSSAEPVAVTTERVQLIVDRLRTELGISERVSVAILPQVM